MQFQGKQNFLKKGILREKNVPLRKIQELKLAFSEFYLSLILLQNYQNLNFTGFRKILKKHDKVRNLQIIIKSKSRLLVINRRNRCEMESRTRRKFSFLYKQRHRSFDPRNRNNRHSGIRRW